MLRRGHTIPAAIPARTPESPAGNVSDSSHNSNMNDRSVLEARSKHAVDLYRCAKKCFKENDCDEALRLLEEALEFNHHLNIARSLQDQIYAHLEEGRSPAWAHCSVSKSCPSVFQGSSVAQSSATISRRSSTSSSSSSSSSISRGSSRAKPSTYEEHRNPAVIGESNDHCPMSFGSISPGTRRNLFAENQNSLNSSPESVRSSASKGKVHSNRRRSGGSRGRRHHQALNKSVDSVPFLQLGKSSSFSEGVSLARSRAASQRQPLLRTKSQSFAQQINNLSSSGNAPWTIPNARDPKRLRLSLDSVSSVGSSGPFHFNGLCETLDDDNAATRTVCSSASSVSLASVHTEANHLDQDPESTTGYSPTFITSRNEDAATSSSSFVTHGAPTPVISHSPTLPRSRQRSQNQQQLLRTPKLQDESPEFLIRDFRSRPGTSADASFLSPQPFPSVLTPKMPGSAGSVMSGIEGPALTESPELINTRRGAGTSKVELGNVRRRFDQLEVEEKDPSLSSERRSIPMEETEDSLHEHDEHTRNNDVSRNIATSSRFRVTASASAMSFGRPLPFPEPTKRSEGELVGTSLPQRQTRKAKQRDRRLACPSTNLLRNRGGKENGSMPYNSRTSALKCAKTPARQLGGPPCFETPTRDQQCQLASAQFDPALVVNALEQAGVRMLALDFDNTLIATHTKGQFRGSVKDLKIRPIFRSIVPAVLEAGIAISIVTFSPQVQIVKQLLSDTFPTVKLGSNTFVCGALPNAVLASCNLSFSDAENKQSPMCYSPRQVGKRPHIRMVCDEHAWANKCDAIGLDQVLLVDDDKNNIDTAKRAGIKAVWFRADYEC
eukprot:CAMPEP_0171549722 /NCGR_PEP_ID=MMETSP0960-20121227/6609_1 /TAXON_ID=87120 /ORGANISM="Aurantiochytrium limacinum, Strain ATCCMYA-1381" /LENGTH=836 /DNA_ID=CAMNT_0012098463 /DNA_START=846 /DNA_END=3354 /DNA_ORIENTATION=+